MRLFSILALVPASLGLANPWDAHVARYVVRDASSCSGTITTTVTPKLICTSVVTSTTTYATTIRAPSAGVSAQSNSSSSAASPTGATKSTTNCFLHTVTSTAIASTAVVTTTTTVTTTSTQTTSPTPSQGCQSARCGNYTIYPCNSPLGDCACGVDPTGNSFCFQDNYCDQETTCASNSDCPAPSPGSEFRCLIGGCCNVGKCVKVEPASTCRKTSSGSFLFSAVDRKSKSDAKRAVCTNGNPTGCQKK